jgi:hypothetical protein
VEFIASLSPGCLYLQSFGKMFQARVDWPRQPRRGFLNTGQMACCLDEMGKLAENIEHVRKGLPPQLPPVRQGYLWRSRLAAASPVFY